MSAWMPTVLYYLVLINSNGYWHKLIYKNTTCLNASILINNDSFSVFIMIKGRFSYKETLKNFINILYRNSKQLNEQPELVLFDFNSRILVQIPSSYYNIFQYRNIKLTGFECLIPCKIREIQNSSTPSFF
ncbi:unnamed protein product [Didymodactylos carnosus]|uniref:Uncharacterized protein n=1 Tax=Didymodactylos carnosus TaxID=1234261 RepID=A0A815XGX5_9BILA|nr:unnamed protein product [Didymodactylos carnosus]CAF1557663.1 unnamed protein product [Didymodactylos carnosus]CAF3874939.1 unnamed protein product [Didymodactylos carnosus]CAF4418957.1 unnamed protein product [Didymodactylos carnosus]